MAIIGIVGQKGSGKTTACNIIKKHLKGVQQINFKDALVQEIKDRFPDLLEEIEIHYNLSTPQLFIQKPPLMRALLQNFGTEVRRGDRDTYWTSKWSVAVVQADATNVLTDDVRFLNEAKAIREAGGILIRLERTDLKNNDQHQSEQEQKKIDCDYVITVGEGELDKLEEELLKIINHGK